MLLCTLSGSAGGVLTVHLPVSATLGAFAITQRKQEPQKEYYWCLTVAHFQGCIAPWLEEEYGFKFLFLHNPHYPLDGRMSSCIAELEIQPCRRSGGMHRW